MGTQILKTPDGPTQSKDTPWPGERNRRSGPEWRNTARNMLHARCIRRTIAPNGDSFAAIGLGASDAEGAKTLSFRMLPSIQAGLYTIRAHAPSSA